MKTIDEIRAELKEGLRARQHECDLLRNAIAALIDPGSLPSLTDIWAEDDVATPRPASQVEIPPEEAKHVHDELDHEAHAGETVPWGDRQKLQASARDAIVKSPKKWPDLYLTAKLLAGEMGSSVSWARTQLKAAERRGIVEPVNEPKPGVEQRWQYVVPSAQAAARVRARGRLMAKSKPVPGTGKGPKVSGDKDIRKQAVAAAKAGAEVRRTGSGHVVTGRPGDSQALSGRGRQKKNAEAAVRRQAS